MRFEKACVVGSTLFLFLIFHYSSAQVKEYKGRINQQFVMNSQTVILNKSTGKRISYQTYEQLLRDNPGKYKTVPVFDKYGEPSSFAVMRKLGGDDSVRDVNYDPDLLPEVGEALPPFVMNGLDGKTYDSEKLKGKYVLLGFWVKYEKPLWTLASTKVISTFVEENQRRGIEVVSLGTTLNSEEECREAIPRRNCGFIPIPESYGFNHRYKIGETPYFILLDKNGVVVATAQHTEFDKISSLVLRK
jgi:cytochrome oxidase Cu insertion factor (SCO1/SenC/PrrC family)